MQGLAKLDSIISGCQDWFENFKRKPNHNPHNLSDDEILALGFYTYDLGVNGGKQDENFYFQLNEMLRRKANGNQKVPREWQGYLYFLQTALSKFPSKILDVYRGIPNMSVIKEQYTLGRTVHWSSFSSATTNQKKAIEFATRNGVVLKLKTLTGKNITAYSVFPEEEEILLAPNINFSVIEEVHNDGGVNYVDLQEQDPIDPFVW